MTLIFKGREELPEDTEKAPLFGVLNPTTEESKQHEKRPHLIDSMGDTPSNVMSLVCQDTWRHPSYEAPEYINPGTPPELHHD